MPFGGGLFQNRTYYRDPRKITGRGLWIWPVRKSRESSIVRWREMVICRFGSPQKLSRGDAGIPFFAQEEKYVLHGWHAQLPLPLST
jgi:hypothetical protein